MPGAVCTPSHCMRPLRGSRIVSKTTAATATDVIAVDEKTIWKNAVPRSFWLAKTARASPRNRPNGTAMATKMAVERSESRNAEDLMTSKNCDVPT